jgi:hypothetical protein
MESKALSAKLNHLESHLYLWIAKYNVWIPGNKKHSLVYLADEAHHGKEFPFGIEGVLNTFLEKYYSTSFPFSSLEGSKS